MTIRERKPDTVLYCNEIESSFNIYAIGIYFFFVFFSFAEKQKGDNKKRRVKKMNFTDGEKGHIIELMLSLYQEQPWRTINQKASVNGCEKFCYINNCVGFLSDGYLIQFFCLRIDRDTKIIDESKVLNLQSEGVSFFLGLLTVSIQ